MPDSSDLENDPRWRALDGQTVGSLFVGAHVIDPNTEVRGQVEQLLPDGSGLVRLEDGSLVKIKPASPPGGP
jgi:hypothetical protein